MATFVVGIMASIKVYDSICLIESCRTDQVFLTNLCYYTVSSSALVRTGSQSLGRYVQLCFQD